jgi:hypothetical protein
MIFVACYITIFEPNFWISSYNDEMHLWWIYHDFIFAKSIISSFMLVFNHKYV